MANVSQKLSFHIDSRNGLPWASLLAPAILSYTALCALLRFRRRSAMQAKFNYPDKASLSSMTNVDAQAIIQYLSELEFPLVYEKSVQFALFKTYGIPTISELLVSTKEFTTEAYAEKRYADTSVLIQEFSKHHPKSERSIQAISRMNYIHSNYQKSGKISNNDLLYTLSVFITEPISWIAKYEWRQLNDMEVCAVATFWKSVGDAMGIDYKGCLARCEWANGLEFCEDITNWALAYEKSYMVPATSNKKTADYLMPLLLFYVPKRVYSFATNVVGVVMGDRLRTSMMYPPPSKRCHNIVISVFAIRKFVLRHFVLPRPSFMKVRQVSEPDPNTGRFYLNTYLVRPYYNKPGFLNRWGPEAWFTWANGGQLPNPDASQLYPNGYNIADVGPRRFEGKGVKEMNATAERLRVERPAGCPFLR